MWAVEGEQLETVQCLVELGCDREIEDIERGTPLQLAVTESRLDIVNALLLEESDARQIDWEDNTLLHLAVTKAASDEDNADALEIIKLLLEKGVDVSHQNSDDRTAHQLALDLKCPIRLLLLFAGYLSSSSPSSPDSPSDLALDLSSMEDLSRSFSSFHIPL